MTFRRSGNRCDGSPHRDRLHAVYPADQLIPFDRIFPVPPPDGADLNPLLQDSGSDHPSAHAVYGLRRFLGGVWLRYCGHCWPVELEPGLGPLDVGPGPPWPGLFLTLGIALGSWWAYYELGWGGWWFWDPVENASFMPWLVGTALVHSLSATEKRGVFKSWTVLLAIAAFSLSLLGAFIVRSGVLTSVHAFAVDPTRGLFILGFLVVVIGGSLLLYALRVPAIRSRSEFGGLSRELLLLVNNLLLVLSMAIVLFGTLAPIAYEAISGGGKISIGPPYFNRLFLPLMGLLAIALGASPLVRWKHTRFATIARSLATAFALAFVLGVVLPVVGLWLMDADLSIAVVLALLLAGWIVVTHALDLWARISANNRPPAGYWGMLIAHLGFAISIVGVAITSVYSFEKDLRMVVGDRLEAGGAIYEFIEIGPYEGPNYVADRGRFGVTEGADYYELLPEKRRYQASNNIMTEAAIEPGFWRDLYISLGESLGADAATGKPAWAVRVQHKPLVRWVWFGALLMALGGTLALFDKRYRRLAARERRALPVGPATAGLAAETVRG